MGPVNRELEVILEEVASEARGIALRIRDRDRSLYQQQYADGPSNDITRLLRKVLLWWK
jgi:hypothetical protein